MTRSRRALGALGEEIAARHLERIGYRLAERNVRLFRGELDIVAWDGETLVFVEVRARRGEAMGSAAESVGPRKQRRLAELAAAYLHARRLGEVPCRFDVIAVYWSGGGEAPRIDHFVDAFSLP